MSNYLTRRSFFVLTAQAAASALYLPRTARAEPSEGLRLAQVGVAGMGRSDYNSLTSHNHARYTVFCDVDAKRLDGILGHQGSGKGFSDYRKMFDEAADKFDAVVISTPDHMHAPIAMRAMLEGKHVYCQKPLAHNISECRVLAETARAQGVITQMGIQIHSRRGNRLAVAMVQSGVIGKIKEAHSWSNKDWGGRPGWLEPAKHDVPAHLDWDLWVGAAPWHDYAEGRYHPGQWRRWIDFGTGTQGDMACHIVDPVFFALDLGYPHTVWADGPKPYETMWPNRGACHYVFPGTRYAVENMHYHWYDGDNRPDKSDFGLEEGRELPSQGSVLIGEKGNILLPHESNPQLLPMDKFPPTEAREIIRGLDVSGRNHYHDWIETILGRDDAETTADFGYSGPLTETVLMGLVASRFPDEKLKWDADNMRFTNKPEADQYLRKEYRSGHEVPSIAQA